MKKINLNLVAITFCVFAFSTGCATYERVGYVSFDVNGVHYEGPSTYPPAKLAPGDYR